MTFSNVAWNPVDQVRIEVFGPAEDGSVTVGQRHFDICIVVPLAEEFRYMQEVTPLLESISHAGSVFYSLDIGAVSAICCVAGQMGT